MSIIYLVDVKYGSINDSVSKTQTYFYRKKTKIENNSISTFRGLSTVSSKTKNWQKKNKITIN